MPCCSPSGSRSAPSGSGQRYSTGPRSGPRSSSASSAASVPLAVLGLRISAPVAEYFAFAARRIHPDVRCLTFGGSVVYDALLHVSEAGGRWLVAFALPRYPAETVQALRFARQLGMRTAVITDARFVPFATDADVLLAEQQAQPVDG